MFLQVATILTLIAMHNALQIESATMSTIKPHINDTGSIDDLPKDTLVKGNTDINIANSHMEVHHNNTISQDKNTFWEIFQFTSNIILLVSGFIGNMLIILTILQNKSMQNLQNFFVFSLAVMDLTTVVVIIPLNLLVRYISWPFGEFVCKYVVPICDIIPVVSILLLVTISIDRYRVIVVSSASRLSLRQGVSLMVFIWVVSYIVIALPLTFVLVVTKGYWTEKTCHAIWSSEILQNTYYILRTLFAYIVPATFIFLCFCRVHQTMGRNQPFLRRSVQGDSQLLCLNRQKRVVRIFFIIFIVFVICYFPINFVSILFLLSENAHHWKYAGELFQFSTIFALVNSICNPIILYKLSKRYKISFRQYLQCLGLCICCRRNSSNGNFNETEDDEFEDGEEDTENISRRKSTKLLTLDAFQDL